MDRVKADDVATFGSHLRRYRTALGLTQEALAERAGLSARAISDLERGVRTKPWHDTVALLAEALQLTPEQREALEGTIRRARSVPDGLAAQPPAQPLPLEEVTPLWGREQEEAAVMHLLRRGNARLLTLTGPGGIGKTRLALRVARMEAANYPDGVRFVPLAPLRDPEHVALAITQALGLHDVRGQSVRQSLYRYLQPRRMLILLDNIEHLLDATSFLAELLASCPQLTLLVTSREPLRIRAEQEFSVPPLAGPRTDSLPANDLVHYPATALFLARVRAVNPGFHLSDAAAPAIVSICRQLDGIPLAIELAAARLKYESVQQLLSHFPARFEVLIDGPRDAPPRHRTMRNCIAWSYDLLSMEEQALFRRLAVFAGGCTIATAQAVCAYGTISQADVAPLLFSLIDTSLLVVSGTDADQSRFTMLETIREYAWERLVEQGEMEKAQSYFCHHYRALAEEAWREAFRAHEATVFGRLKAERDNVRAVLTWAADHDVELALTIAGSIYRHWIIDGRCGEWRGWIERTLARYGSQATPVRAQAVLAIGWLALHEGHIDMAAGRLQEGLDIARATGDRLLNWIALEGLGMVELSRGRGPQAAAHFREGSCLCRAMGAMHRLAPALYGLGLAFQVDGQLDHARTALEESIAISRGYGERISLGSALRALGGIALAQGEYAEALAHYRDGLQAAVDVHHREGIASALDGIVPALAALGELESAARFWGAAEALHEELFGPAKRGDDVPLARLPQLSPHLRTISNHFTEPLWLAAQTEGQTASLADLIALVEDVDVTMQRASR